MQGNDILMRCIHQLAAKEQRGVNLFVLNQKAYFIAPNAVGEVRTNFSKWDFCREYRKWLGASGEGAATFVPQARYVTLSRLLKSFPEEENNADVYNALLPDRELSDPRAIVALTDAPGRGEKYVSALWSVPGKILLDELLRDQQELPPHMLSYSIRTKYWKLSFPSENGIQLERRKVVYTGDSLERHPFRESKDHPGDETIESQLFTLLQQKQDIETLQAEYRASTNRDATLK